jgi:membrane protein YdbS with pleckstrin-like domain
MSSPAPEKPVWKTGTLWGILAVLLVFGSVGAGTFVYGLLGVAAGVWIDAVVAVLGVVVALLAMLFMIGILYRVDRYRGALGRRVELFE